MPDPKHQLKPEAWVDLHADYLFNYAVVRLNDEEQAADAVQETFLSALKARERFRGESSEKTWLTSILKRKIIDIYRKKGSNRESLVEDFREQVNDGDFFTTEEPFRGHWRKGSRPHSDSLLPSDEIENEELRDVIEKCIGALPENLSAVFVMKMVDEIPSEEVCKELGLTPSNLWVMMHRARLKMRACIEKTWK